MKVITADGREVAVGAQASTGSGVSAWKPSWAGQGSVELVRGAAGRRRSIRYAEVARANPWVRAAMDARAAPGSRVPIHVFRPDPESPGDKLRVRAGTGGAGDQLARLLMLPQPGVSPRRWRRRILNDTLIHDNAIAEIITNGSTVVELRWHPWVDVEWELASDGLTIEVFSVPDHRDGAGALPGRTSGKMRTIDRDQVLHFVPADEVSGAAGPVGVSKLASLHNTHALHDAAMRFAIAYMNNGVMPSGVVELHPQASVEAAAATRELLEAVASSVDRAGKPLAIAGKWHQVMATPEGAKLVELARFSREEVAAAFRLSLTDLGDSSQANRAVGDTNRERFIRDVVGDDVGMLESEIQAQLVDRRMRWSAAGIHVEAQLAEMLRPDMSTLSQVIRRQVGGPVMTPNDGRRLINLPPLDDPRADALILNPGTPETDVGVDDPADPNEDGNTDPQPSDDV